MTVLVLAAQAAAAGRAAAAAHAWRSRFCGRAAVFREALARLLPLVSGAEAARPAAPAGSAEGDCLAALEAVTAGLRRLGGLAAVAAHEVAAHLTGGLWLAPAVPALNINTTWEPGGIIALPFPAAALRRVVVHGTIAALAACVAGAAR
jgi:hypothetical protein